MSRQRPFPVLCAAALLGASFSPALAVVPTEFTWSGRGTDTYLNTAGNWSGNAAPQLDGSEILKFPDSASDLATVAGSGAHGLQVEGHLHLKGVENSFGLGSGGLTFTSTYATHLAFEGYLNVTLNADQTWSLGANTRVEFYDSSKISGAYKLTKTGAGTLDLSAGNSSWSGGLQFDEGRIVLRPGSYGESEDESRSLGTGTVTLGTDTTNRPTFQVYDWAYNREGGDDEVNLTNDFVLNGVFASENHAELNLLGEITLQTSTTFRTRGDITYVHGSVSENNGPAKLTIDSTSGVILLGASGWSGGTDVTKGILIFGGESNNLPTGGTIKVAGDGYVGVTTNSAVPSLLEQLDAASTGTIGFDSDNVQSPTLFNSASVDLSGFDPSLRLGSATSAILGSGFTITPKGNNYRFGGGGGWLQVGSALASSGSTLTLDSPAPTPLTVRFTNTSNAFTSVSVTNSGAVFAPDALPGSATLSVANGAYLGTEDTAFSADSTALDSYIARFGAGTQGIIGFDIDQFNLSASTREVDLTGANLGSLTGGGYLGTASALYSDGEVTGPGVRFTGTIAPNSDNIHRFAAYKGGALEIAGTLTGNSMIIGHPDSLGAFGDRNREEYSTVFVSGNNANKLAGGVTLYGGRLLVGQHADDGTIGSTHTHALGEGTLTIAPVGFTIEEEEEAETPTPLLSAAHDNLIISNAIAINADELNVGGDHAFKLEGVISGSGELFVGEESDSGFTLTLSGDNSYSGGTYVTNNAVLKAEHNSALGDGKLVFEGPGSVEFGSAVTAPVVHGIESYTNEASIKLLSGNSPRLRIVQDFDSTYMGELRADSGGTGTYGAFVKEGSGTLRLNDVDIYGYGQGQNGEIIEVQGGTLVLADVSFESNSTAIEINGGTLAVENNKRIYNPVVVTSGRLAGNGIFESDITIGSGAILSPGLAGTGNIGRLEIDHLELDAGGVLEWHIQNPSSTDGKRDYVKVGVDEESATLVINATSDSDANKFTLKIISLNLAGAEGALDGVDVGHGQYAWTLFAYDAIEFSGEVFDPAAFKLDLSLFATAQGSGEAAGTFQIFQQNDQIMLGFTPVPEPSTYALLALGLGFIGLAAWRRRRS